MKKTPSRALRAPPVAPPAPGFAGALRVFAYGLIVATCGLALHARSVAADVGGRVREETGRLRGALVGLAELTEGAETVRLNGAVIRRASAVIDAPSGAVLDRFERACDEEPGAFGELLRSAPSDAFARAGAGDGAGPSARALRLGVLRDEGDSGGTLVCFAGRGGGDASPAERMRRFVETTDIASLGQLRFVTTSPSSAGGTRVVTLWAEGPVSLREMFPPAGDARGFDSPRVPRPPASRRLVTAGADGTSSVVRVYSTTAPAEEIDRFYDEELARDGFERAPSPDSDGRGYLRADGALLFVTRTTTGDGTLVTLVDAQEGSAAQPGRPARGGIVSGTATREETSK